MQLFELSCLSVLPHIIPCEGAAIHGYIDTVGEGLGESQGATQIEEPVGATEFIGDHCACQDDGLVFYFFGQYPGGDGHGVGAVCDDDLVFVGVPALVGDEFPVFIRHVEAVDHHQRSYGDVQGAACALEHFGQVGFLKKKFAGELVVFFVEGTACDEYTDGDHGDDFGREDSECGL